MLTYADVCGALGTQAAGLWLRESCKREREQALEESQHRFQATHEADRVAQVVYITTLLAQVVYITTSLAQPPQPTASPR